MLKVVFAALVLFGAEAFAQSLSLPGTVTGADFVNSAPGVFTGCGDMNGVAARYRVVVNPPSLTLTPTPPPGSWTASILWGCSPNGQLGVGWGTNSLGRFTPFWVNSVGTTQTLSLPPGPTSGQLFGVTDSGEVAGGAGLPIGGNTNTGLSFLVTPAGTITGGANGIAVATTSEAVRAGARVDGTTGRLVPTLDINGTPFDLPATSAAASINGLSQTANRACGQDNNALSLWNVNVATRTFSQIIPRDASNAIVAGFFRRCLANGLAWGKGTTLGGVIYDPPTNTVMRVLDWANRYGIAHSWGSTNPSDVWSIAHDPSTGRIIIATPGSLNVTIGNSPAAIFGPDVNGDGVADCTDVAIVRAAFGTRPGQIGWNPQADVNRDNVVNIRDLAIVRRGLPVGTVCP